MRYYAGIGSRETPSSICTIMTQLASKLEQSGYCLRSGGADGADYSFERGVKNPSNKQIFLPWKNFNKNPSPLYNVSEEAMAMGKMFHPKWDKLRTTAKCFHARNCYQVLGVNLDDPVDFVLCWTRDGKATGGTGQAIRIAQAYCIPVYNLRNEGDKFMFELKLKEDI